MEGNNVEKVLKHARNLRWLILGYTLIYIGFALWNIYVKDVFSIDYDLKIYHVLLLGFPITCYAIWYILNVSPDREQNKTGNVLGLLFFGIIGLWMTYPREKNLIKRLNARKSFITN